MTEETFLILRRGKGMVNADIRDKSYRVGRRSRYLLVTAPMGTARSPESYKEYICHTHQVESIPPAHILVPFPTAPRQVSRVHVPRPIHPWPIQPTCLPIWFTDKYSIAHRTTVALNMQVIRQTIEFPISPANNRRVNINNGHVTLLLWVLKPIIFYDKRKNIKNRARYRKIKKNWW